MSHTSTTDKQFLGQLEQWIEEQHEILTLIRYSRAAGAKDFEFFSSFETIAARLRQLPECASVIAFRQPQLPFRGTVDDGFIAACLNGIPDGSEYLIAETIHRTA